MIMCRTIIHEVLTKRKRCQTCLTRTAVDVHHIIPKRLGGLDVPENLTSVCELCHKQT